MLNALKRSTAVLIFAALSSTAAHADTTICDQFGSTAVSGGKYIVQNNRWGASTTQCIDVGNAGFTEVISARNGG